MDRQEWIDKACEWLRNNLPGSKPPLQLIAEFREAMTAGQSDGDSSDPAAKAAEPAAEPAAEAADTASEN